MPMNLEIGTLDLPLVVDLDGTLIQTDLLIESFFAHVGTDPGGIFKLAAAALTGKSRLKAEIAQGTALDAAHLPYDRRILSLINEARSHGRQVYLASASNERYVGEIAAHLGLFDGWFGSTENENLSSEIKARRLVETFGEKRFDYVGDSRADLAVWAAANKCIGVDLSTSLCTALRKIDPEAVILQPPDKGWRNWLKLLRLHQWSKNTLVFVAPLSAHLADLRSIALSSLAFCAFSFAAASIYIVNDLVDIEADRKHRTKRLRPLAAGTVPPVQAMLAAPLLLAVSLCLGLLISWRFALVLGIYLVLTTAYTFYLKTKMMLDVIVLASLYTLRVISGALAISTMLPSEWLLGFSMFFFTSMALIKRYVDLAVRVDGGLPDPTNRNYRKSDLGTVGALAAASGLNAVTIFALYISSGTVHRLYRHPDALWLVCPVLMYWIARALIMADRRLMHDDPIMFALKDRNSLLALGLIGLIMIAAA
jgi:4-hydroxybenzoate polyprenyltransferase/phosphoserine phosphatase